MRSIAIFEQSDFEHVSMCERVRPCIKLCDFCVAVSIRLGTPGHVPDPIGVRANKFVNISWTLLAPKAYNAKCMVPYNFTTPTEYK